MARNAAAAAAPHVSPHTTAAAGPSTSAEPAASAAAAPPPKRRRRLNAPSEAEKLARGCAESYLRALRTADRTSPRQSEHLRRLADAVIQSALALHGGEVASPRYRLDPVFDEALPPLSCVELHAPGAFELVPSRIDTLKLCFVVYVPTRVVRAVVMQSRHGMGAFAVSDVAIGTAVAPFDGEYLTCEEFAALGDDDGASHTFSPAAGIFVNGLDGGSAGMHLANSAGPSHSARNNAALRCKMIGGGKTQVTVRAERALTSGDEILVKYGSSYWREEEKREERRRSHRSSS